MKILIDARLYGLENAGLGRYLINLVSEIVKIDKKDEFVLFLREKYYYSLELPKNWKKVLVDFRHYSIAEQIKLPGLISKEKPDIVHFPHFNAPIFCCWTGNPFHKGRFIVTIHDMLMHDFAGLSASTLPAPLYFLKQSIYKFVFGRAVIKSSRIIVPSDAVRVGLKKYYDLPDSKIETIYEGFDKKIAQSKTNSDRPYFIYTGNAYPHKNLNRLIEAIAMLNKNRNKKINLVIASSRNVFTERLENVIVELNADEFVKLKGFVPDSELGSWYKNSLGFVSPALSEGFGLPGLEAMSCGTLVLASDIPVFREIYKTHAMYFDPFNVSSIEKALENATKMDAASRRRKIFEAQKFSKVYSWVKMATQTLKIYESFFKKESRDSLR